MDKINIIKVYQFSSVLDPQESDWEECCKDSYYEMEGYDIPRRIIEKPVVTKEWLKLWEDFTYTPEYRQSIKQLQFRAFFDWLRENFEVPKRLNQYDR